MGVLDNLFSGTPGSQSSSGSRVTEYPAWYTDLMRGMSANVADVAARPYEQYQYQRVADWTPEHATALGRITGNAGAWDAPIVAGINAVSELPGQVAPTFQAVGNAASAARTSASNPAMQWPDHVQKYMSPYTQQVVDNIARLGTRNMTENLLPAANAQFIGAGGFGSTRNAEILGRTMRDVNADILGAQSTALQAGYNRGADIFGADANRVLQQQQQQTAAALQGGQLANSAATNWAGVVDNAAARLGALSQLGQGVQTADTNALIMAGDRQKQQQQAQLDAQYQDWSGWRDWDWDQLNKASGVLSKLQIPSVTTETQNQFSTAPGQSGLQWITSLLSLLAADKAGSDVQQTTTS